MSLVVVGSVAFDSVKTPFGEVDEAIRIILEEHEYVIFGCPPDLRRNHRFIVVPVCDIVQHPRHREKRSGFKYMKYQYFTGFRNYELPYEAFLYIHDTGRRIFRTKYRLPFLIDKFCILREE